jgi:hypothetical protein
VEQLRRARRTAERGGVASFSSRLDSVRVGGDAAGAARGSYSGAYEFVRPSTSSLRR